MYGHKRKRLNRLKILREKLVNIIKQRVGVLKAFLNRQFFFSGIAPQVLSSGPTRIEFEKLLHFSNVTAGNRISIIERVRSENNSYTALKQIGHYFSCDGQRVDVRVLIGANPGGSVKNCLLCKIGRASCRERIVD